MEDKLLSPLLLFWLNMLSEHLINPIRLIPCGGSLMCRERQCRKPLPLLQKHRLSPLSCELTPSASVLSSPRRASLGKGLQCGDMLGLGHGETLLHAAAVSGPG